MAAGLSRQRHRAGGQTSLVRDYRHADPGGERVPRSTFLFFFFLPWENMAASMTGHIQPRPAPSQCGNRQQQQSDLSQSRLTYQQCVVTTAF